MKRGAGRSGLAGGLLFAALAHADPALAVTQTGSLGGPASETDFYQVTCSDDGSGAPASLVAQVLDAAPSAPPLVSVQTQRSSPFLASNATDAVDGDPGASPSVALNGGAGSYDVFIDKSAAGAESYLLTVQCMTGANGGGVATGTVLTPISTGAPSVPALSSAGLLALAAGLGLLGAAALRRCRRRAGAAALAALLAASGWPGDARAHTQNGDLGSGASATDFYQVTCSQELGGPPPALLLLQVLDTDSSPAPEAPALLAVQGQKGTLVTNSTDPVGGDAIPSSEVTLDGGLGVYDVLVYKTASGADGYQLIFHCYSEGRDDHTPSSITTRQNQ